MTAKSIVVDFFTERRKNTLQRVKLLATSGAIVAALLAALFLYLETPSIWLFHTIGEYNNIVVLAFISLAIMLLGWDIWRCKKKKYRTKLVIAWAAIGIFFAGEFLYLLGSIPSLDFFFVVKNLVATIFLLLMSAPLSYCLWSWRNEDKLKQIAQADKQNKHNEEQSRLNSLSNAMRLFLEIRETHAKAVGLMTLARIKNESVFFNVEIDMVTSGADLQEIDLTSAYLERINLSRAKLMKAFLDGANCTGCDFTNANLTGASIRGANLTEANLKNADLINLEVGVYEKDVYKESAENTFSREDIEAYLKKDWSKYETYAQVKKKEGNNEIYYLKGKVAGSPAISSSSSISPAYSASEKNPPRYGIGVKIRSSFAYEKYPKSAEEYYNRGQVKLESGDFDGAIKDFDEAIELDEYHAGAYRSRAFAKMQKGMK